MVLLLVLLICAQGLHDVHSRNVVEIMAANDGYQVESHSVITEDGYILEVNRIPDGRDGPTDARRPVVFLMHGLMASATSYMLLGPEASMAYNLADAGFDVWMGNARGVLNSRNHVKLNPDKSRDRKKFFDYSFHEIGVYDVAAMVDYALQATGENQLHYIGHSQGGSAFFALASTRPEYNAKFKSVHLMAGVGYMKHFPSKILARIARRTDRIHKVTSALGYVEVLRPRNWPWINSEVSCAADDSETCELYLAVETLGAFIDPNYQVYGSAAVKQIAHFGQNVNSRTFRQWDYGAVRNLIQYGRRSPPEYDLRRITADVTMHYTVNDVLLGEQDVLDMAVAMPNARVRKLADEKFKHSDFMFNADLKHLVTDYIIDELRR